VRKIRGIILQKVEEAMNTINGRSKQPNSRMCFVCGMENPVGLRAKFYSTAPGCVEAEWTAPDHFQGYTGVLHGGITATLLDEAAGRTTMSGDPTRFMVTMKLEARYRKPIPVGQPLRITGELVRDRGRLAETIARIVLPDGSVGAEATIWLAVPSADMLPVDELEQLGWRIYPDESASSESKESS
jgi:acyl-coenzyme A thioesterase PaaI-like protein